MIKVDINMMERRSKALSSKYDKHDCKLYLERAIESSNSNKTTRKNDINRFFSECMALNNANKYYAECIGFIANEDDKLYSKILTESFVYRVLPYVESMDEVNSILPRYKLSFNDYSLIKESVDGFKNCDRIMNNHNIIQEQIDLDSYMETAKNKSINRILPKICDTIYENTVDEQTPCQMLSLTIDEASYLLQKHRVKYNASDMVKFVTEYYLMKPSITNDDHYAFRNVVNEHSMLTQEDTSSIRYFTELYDSSKSNLMHLLNNFIMSESKNVDEDFCYIIRSMPVGFMIAREDFLDNFGNILGFINDHMLTEDYEFDPILRSLRTIPESIMSQMNDDTWNYNRDELGSVLYHYENAIEAIDIELANIPENANVTKKLISLKDCYKESVQQLDELSSLIYTNDNLKIMENMSVMVENSHAFYLNEFKLMRFATIVKTAIEIDQFIKTKGKKLMDKISGKIGLKKKNKKNLKDINIFETITESGNVDMCVCSFDIFDESDFWCVHDVMTEFCKQLNENVLRSDETKVYYIVNSDTVDIRLEDSSTILLSDEDKVEISETMSYEDKCRCLELNEMISLFESIDIDLFSNITSLIESKIPTLNYDTFCSILEASKFVDTISKDDVNSMTKQFMESHNNSARNTINWYLETWVKEESPIEIQIEACNLISALLESEDEKKEINKKKKEDKEKEEKKSLRDKIKEKADKKKEEKENKSDEESKTKNPHSGVNLNTLKLYVKGLKAKMKDMTNKEKEWSRNIDMNFNRLAKACKDVLVSDRREAIIKGSIIPSFSKSIKLGIAMAGLTFINPVAAAVTAIGGIAMSKNLTRKERLLLLDEISTELEVVDKEIDMAESSKNMKKYRKLLQYKKDLQRQYQRIKYNVRIGKDILPGSTTGIKDKD